MFKKFFMLLMAAMLNVVAWAEPALEITPYRDGKGEYTNYDTESGKYYGHAGATTFYEPSVVIKDGDKNLTSRYILTYMIDDNAPAITGGVSLSTDSTTGSSVESNYGQVSLGKSGSITVNVSATRREGYTAVEAPDVASASYTIRIDALEATYDLSPELPTTDKDGYDYQILLNTVYSNNSWAAVKSAISRYSVTSTYGDTNIDITDHFDITVEYTPAGSDSRITLSDDKRYLEFAERKEPTITGITSGTLTYTFTPKTEYTGYYNSVVKKVYVGLNQVTAGDEKVNLVATLYDSSFFQENITKHEGDDLPQINVYKYGLNDAGSGAHVIYSSPVPTLSYDGTIYPQVSTNGGGAWGDFRMVYVIESDEGYADDCQYIPFQSGKDNIKAAGYPTEFQINENTFQVGGGASVGTGYGAGLIKVKGYAVLEPDEWYGITQKAMFKQLGTIEQFSRELPYYATVEFYVNVMKRKPEVVISPDPSTITFGKGDVITMNERFDIYGYKSGDDSNGIEGVLVFDPSDKKWEKYGNEVDKLSYSFFISRTYQAGKIAISDWPLEAGLDTPENRDAWEAAGGDRYSYKWRYPSPYTAEDKIDIDAGDYIRVTSETSGAEEIEGNYYIKITDANKSIWAASHPYLTKDDLEGGIMYNSMKEWGNESWTMTFLQAGPYDIPYLLHQYNHVRWDSSGSDLKPYHFVVSDKIAAELQLSYYYTVARKGQGADFDEPTAKVVLSSFKDIDVTEDFDITYSMEDVTAETETYTYNDEDGWTKYIHPATGTILYTKGDKEEVVIGNTGRVNIVAHATKKDGVLKEYGTVADKIYTINIVDADNMAQWEVISTTGRNCHAPASDKRFADISDALGHMHFLPMENYDNSTEGLARNGGVMYGGTVISGVPGISMTIGSVPTDHEATADWLAIVPATDGTGKCCDHETATVVVKPIAPLVLDNDDDLPVSGAYYKFVPTVNGFLTVDAKFTANHKHILIAQSTKEEVIYTPSEDVYGYEFQQPLLAGETYYLYDFTNSVDLNIHGFWFLPAFLKGTETKDTWTEPYRGTTFLNSLSNGIPKLLNSSDDYVLFTVSDDNSPAMVVSPKTVDDYLTVGEHTGKLNPKAITVKDSEIFYLKVNAAVSSTLGSTYSDCTKYPYYYARIIDIPKYQVVKTQSNMPEIEPATKISTTNIKTDITMTLGNFGQSDGSTFGANQWVFKGESTGHKSDGELGVADRIGNPNTYCDDESYNKTIDGFVSFYSASVNPYDENGSGALVGANGNSYTYGSGTDYEALGNKYNTTYRLPSRGTYLKFEPRESGTLMVYLVQNGSCDYYAGRNPDDDYQLKWRPLYITDETGKPVTMVNSFDNISEYLPSAEDMVNAGSYTLGLSRCSKNEEAVKASSAGKDLMEGCTFDWTNFKGTMADREHLMEAWPNTGEPESIIRLENGGFVLPHKAYVRYSFEIKAGKTYFVFQPGSKFEFGGFAFVPTGFPENCKYTYDSTPDSYKFNSVNQEKNWSGAAARGTELTYDVNTVKTAKDAQTIISDPSTLTGSDYQAPAGRDINFTWDLSATRFTTDKENLVLTINDRRNSELTSSAAAYATNKTQIKPRTFVADQWESICLPFSVSEQEMTRVFGEDYVLVTCNGLYENTQSLLFVRHANRYVEAGRPYFIKPTKDGVFSFRNVTIEGGQTIATYDGGVDKVPNQSRFNLDINNNEFVFKGTYMRETVPAGSYFMYSDATHDAALYKYSGDVKIGGYRAYFQKQTKNPAASLPVTMSISDLMFIEDGGETTDVLTVSEDGTINSLPHNAGVYTIDGQKVGDSPLDLRNMPSGLYIVNGKKYIK